ncbi:hypothetical protein [Neobacillus vireti]|uniref:Integral inner membrane protein n=1 Tax=Neobacillus vireti LMG 21834 TaxID=1131730 RepID=A0AB94IQJ3_9BACI|nr:hypothetical protein [Neobacillus vireti]ETI69319.1 hypothetical protein BAVI_07921 [Neobacillus vireti LMG 21834]KLT19848.1 hypothetical protein AA980_04645 [Neobacillus vireti]
MRFFVKLQGFAILFALFWVVYINILAFFDQPGRAMQYINWFVYGFGFLFAIIYFLLTKYFIGRNWRAVPLILIPYFLVYQPIFHQLLFSLVHDGYGMMIRFLSLSTGTIHFLMVLFGVIFGIIFSGRHQKV